MDDVDRADQQIEQSLASALAKTRKRAAEVPLLTGECYFCGEPVEGRRWCDVFCRDRQEFEAARRPLA